LRAGLGAAAVTCRALSIAGEMQGRGDALRGVGEVECERGLDVGAALWPGCSGRTATTPAAAEHLAQQVAEAIAADVEVEPALTRPAGLEAADRPELADLVVLLALDLVAQNVVCRADLLEPFLGGIVAGMGV